MNNQRKIITFNKEDYDTVVSMLGEDKVILIQDYQRLRIEKPGCRWGRKPLEIDMEKVNRLRDNGLSYHRIAREIGCTERTLLSKIKETI